jgi:MFS family permease
MELLRGPLDKQIWRILMDSENTKSQKQRLITPIIGWFLGAMILANISGFMLSIFLPLYLRDELDASISQVGLVFTLASIIPFVLQIFGGWLSDTIGRLRTIAIGATIATFGTTLIVFAPNWRWVAVAVMLDHVSNALVGPSFGAFIADQTPEENRGSVFGTIGSIMHIISLVAPLLGGFIAYNYGYKLMLIVSAIGYGIATLMRIWMALNPRFTEKQYEGAGERFTFPMFEQSFITMLGMILSGGILTWIFITDGIRDIGFSLANNLTTLYTTDIGGLNEQQIGLLAPFSSITMMVLLPFAGRLADRIGERKTIIAGFILQCAGIFGIIFARRFSHFAIRGIILAAGFALARPSYDSLISKVVPEDNRGLAYGLFWTSISLFSLPAPYLGGLLWDNFTPHTPFILTSALLLLAVIPAWYKFKLPEKQVISE